MSSTLITFRFFVLIFSGLIMIDFFEFLLFGIPGLLESVHLHISPYFQSYSHHIFKKIFSTGLFLFFGILMAQVLDLLTYYYKMRLCYLSPSIFFPFLLLRILIFSLIPRMLSFIYYKVFVR